MIDYTIADCWDQMHVIIKITYVKSKKNQKKIINGLHQQEHSFQIMV